VIAGGGGRDSLYGGANADTFLIEAEVHFNQSVILIEDFDLAEDNVDLSHVTGIESFEDVAARFDQVGSDAVIYHEASTIALMNTGVSQLTEEHFIF
jgi:Ca2+-binding RTX toxin-like protein